MIDIRCPHCGQIAATVSVTTLPPIGPIQENILDTPIRDYPWGPGHTRIVNCLINGDVVTFRDLCKLRRSNLMCWGNFGKGSADAVEKVLARHGLFLGCLA